MELKEHNALCRESRRAFKLLLRFAWMCGCRPSELRELRWDQITEDFSAATLGNHKTARKTGKARKIYFPTRGQALLRKFGLERDDRKEATVDAAEFVFLNTRGRPWTKDAIVCQMQRLQERTGLDIVAYNYRHTWITRALLAGVDIAAVAELAGHSNTDMVSRTYSKLHKYSDHLSSAVNKV